MKYKRDHRYTTNEVIEYLLLAISGGAFLLFLSIFKGQHMKQFIVSALFILYYILWGIIHHTRDQTLHLKVVLEYILIGGLALILLQMLLSV